MEKPVEFADGQQIIEQKKVETRGRKKKQPGDVGPAIETRGRKKKEFHAKQHQTNFRWDDREYTGLLEAANGEREKVPEVIRATVKDLLRTHVRVQIKGEWVSLSVLEARQLVRELLSEAY